MPGVQMMKKIFVFSDGMIPLLDNNEFVLWFIESVSNGAVFQYEMRQKALDFLSGTNDVDKEKTLVFYEYE